jgi:hypothetical protein
MTLKRLALSVLLVVTVLAGPRAVEAILIQLVYDLGSDGIDACSTLVIKQTPEGPVLDHVEACAGNVDKTPDLTLHLGLAAAHWERIFDNQSSAVTVTLFDPGEARNITISDGNALQVFFHPLHVGGKVEVTGAGSALTVDTSATLEASQVELRSGGMLDVPFNGSAELVQLISSGIIRGAGNIQAGFLESGGTIRSNGDTPLVFTTANQNALFDLTGMTGFEQQQREVAELRSIREGGENGSSPH